MAPVVDDAYFATAIRGLPERLRRLADRIEQYRPDLFTGAAGHELEEYREEVGDFAVIFAGTERALSRIIAGQKR